MRGLPALLLAASVLLFSQAPQDSPFPAFPAALRDFLGLSETVSDGIRSQVIGRRERAGAFVDRISSLRARPEASRLRIVDREDDRATRVQIAKLLTDRQRQILRRLGDTMSPLPRFREAACFYLFPPEIAAKAPPATVQGGAPLKFETPVSQAAIDDFNCPPVRLPQRLLPQ